mmetsp:Transcript_61803/g.149630  ORF Transcript_61803/g.149630 Transcript_61803/m.149630 type:complete len:276 (-) Transcript_61803:191-1018(-)
MLLPSSSSTDGSSGISWITDLKNVSACGRHWFTIATWPHSWNSAMRENGLSMDGMVMWQKAMHALTNAVVFFEWRPFIRRCARIASVAAADTRWSFTTSRLKNAARQSTSTFNCCSRSRPKSIWCTKREMMEPICLLSSSTDNESSPSCSVRAMSSTAWITTGSLVFPCVFVNESMSCLHRVDFRSGGNRSISSMKLSVVMMLPNFAPLPPDCAWDAPRVRSSMTRSRGGTHASGSLARPAGVSSSTSAAAAAASMASCKWRTTSRNNTDTSRSE